MSDIENNDSENELDQDLVDLNSEIELNDDATESEAPEEIQLDNKKKSKRKGRPQRKRKPKKEASIALPNMLLLGYQEGTSRKDLLIFINSKANELMNVDATHYNIIRKDGGYYWELQEGGSGHGVLESVIACLEDQEEVFVKTSRRTMKVIKRQNGYGIDDYMVNEEDSPPQSDGIEYKDKMQHVSSKGTGFMVFGIILALLGTLSLLLAFSFKYGLLNKMADVKLSEISGKVPYTQFSKMKEVVKLESTYIDTLTYNFKSDTYLIKTGQEEMPKEPEKVVEQSAPGLPQEIIDATSNVNQTGKE